MTVEANSNAKPSREVRAEAALWLAHLRGPERTTDVERGFRLWLEAKPEHAIAFERASDIWERTGAVRRRPHERVMGWVQPGPPRTARIVAAAAVTVVAVIATVFWQRDRDEVVTAVGEQRSLTLEDGTRVSFNTDTRASVQYSDRERRIRLERGEAFFEVARQADRPFIVAAGRAQIEALGTSFVVRRDEVQLAVTLVDGKVAVTPADGGEAGEASPSRQVLNPGERLTMSPQHALTIDAPVIDKLTAWQRGQVAFDNAPLREAIAEMNRYSTVKLALEWRQTGETPIGGVFRAGDASSFAQAMAATYGLKVIREEDRIVLAGRVRSPERSRPVE